MENLGENISNVVTSVGETAGEGVKSAVSTTSSLFQNKTVNALDSFYSPELIGHMNGSTFTLSDVKARMLKFNQYACKNKRFSVTVELK